MNSIRNKFEILKTMLSEVLNVLMITETKLDDSFPEQQFYIEGFNIPFRLDRNRHGGGLLLYVRNNINALFLNDYVFPDNIEDFFIEILLKSCKQLICYSYNPNRINVATHLGQIGKQLDTYGRKYEKKLLIGGFNVEPNEANMKAFCYQYNVKYLNKEHTCFKNFNKASSIDLFLTNNSKCFEVCLTLETGLSDFHKLIVTKMKTKHEHFPPKIVNYRDYKNFETKTLKDRLELALENTTSFEELEKIFMDLLNKFASLKCKFLRANHSKFMMKELSKAIMLRTRFRHQLKTPEAKGKYNKQRNICVSLIRKAKRNYYESLDLNNICDNKKF